MPLRGINKTPMRGEQADPISSTGPQLLLLYGSQTGTAQKLAESLALQARHLFHSIDPSNTRSSEHNLSSLTVRLQSIDSYLPLSQLAKETGIVLFVCSTTGYGAPPDNMRQFWQRLMHRSLPVGQTFPSRLRFAVIGLGDSSYPKFNVVAKKLRQRLVQLGASPLSITIPELSGTSKQSANVEGLGVADEQDELGMYGLLSQWVPRLWTILAELWRLQLCLPSDLSLTWSYLAGPEFMRSTWPRFDVYLVDIEKPGSNTTQNNGPGDQDPIRQNAMLDWSEHWNHAGTESGCSIDWFRIVLNKRVTTEDHFQDTRLLQLVPKNQETEGAPSSHSTTSFLPGDVFFLQPANASDDVNLLLQHTNTDPNQRVIVSSRDPCIPIDSLLSCVNHNPSKGISAAWLATYYFDLNAVPTPELFTALAVVSHQALQTSTSSDENYSRMQLEYERLCELGSACWSAEAMDDLNDYVTRPRRRVIEALLDFPVTASKLSLSSWFDILPGPIRARPYSIASAPPHIELLVAVVSYRTRMSTARRGLASTNLASLSPGDIVPGWIGSQVAGGFDFTVPCKSADTTPCLLIAPGTGIAPFRSFLWHQRSLNPDKPDEPINLLVFGCRFPDKDYYFAQEWDQFIREDRIRVINAFSRVPVPSLSGRVYVQHRLREQADLVWSTIAQSNSYIYVAGNAKSMPSEVRQALVTVCQTAGGLTPEAAERFLSQMEAQRRLQIESWS